MAEKTTEQTPPLSILVTRHGQKEKTEKPDQERDLTPEGKQHQYTLSSLKEMRDEHAYHASQMQQLKN